MAEHASRNRMWVPFQCLSRLKPLTRMAEHVFRQWVSSSSQDQNHWEELLNTYPAGEFALWYLSRSEPLTKMVEHTYPECEFTPQSFSRSEPLTWTTEHSSRKWVYSLVFYQTRMTEHSCSKWVCSSILSRITDKNGWTCIQDVSLLSSVWGDYNHSWKWLNMHPDSEFPLHSVQIRATDKNEHPSSKWVALCLKSTSEQLTRIA